MKLVGGIASHVGNVREENQDRAFFGGCVAAVADGMGGHQGGEIAAQVAVSGFDDLDGPVECSHLLGLVSDANSAVFDKAIDPDLRGMGTTLVVLALQPDTDQVTIANVGDSRAYHFVDGTLRQITVDHSLVQDLVTAGKITEEEAQSHPQRNIVTRALGISPTVEADSFMLPARLGDRFLLCSDGLINEVEESVIAEMLAEENPEYVANSLVQAAINEAGRDNVTVAVVDIVEGEATFSACDGDETNRVELDEDPTQPFEEPDVSTQAAVTAPIEVAQAETTDPVLPGDASLLGTGGGFDAVVEGEQFVGQPPEVAETTVPPVVETAVEEPASDGVANGGSTSGLPATIESPKKRSKVGFVAAIGAVLALLVAAFFAINWYGTNSWHLAENDGTVAIYRGQPGGFLWLDAELEESTGISVNELDDASKEKVGDGSTFGSFEEAEAAAANLTESEPELAEQEPAPTPTTTSVDPQPSLPADESELPVPVPTEGPLVGKTPPPTG